MKTGKQEPSDKDILFNDAAELIVNRQFVSLPVLQEYLKIGLNRASRILDELEFYGIVGEFSIEKPREVKFKSIEDLHSHLKIF